VPGDDGVDEQATRARLARFREEVYGCLTRRADALFELCDAVLCAPGPVTSLPELSLALVHRRGHGAMYDALACGRIDVVRLQASLASLELPRDGRGQLRLAVDVTPWPRPDAECSPQRLHCHRPCRCDGIRQTIPGWPYSMVVALQSGRGSWTAPLDAQRIGPDDDVTEVTAAQLRQVVDRLRRAGQHRDGDPPVLIVTDSGYDLVRLAWLLRDLPVHLFGRVRADRVFYAPPGPPHPHGGRPRRHATPLKLSDPTSWPPPQAASSGVSDRYGKVAINAYARRHQRLTRRGGWDHHPGLLPTVDGTLIQVRVDRLPGHRTPKPLWLWHSHPEPADLDLNRLFATFCRRFDAEHTFRFFKQTLGWTRPKLRTPEQADRWTWLILAAYTQLRLARPLAEDLRRPWQPPLPPDRLTPGRVRRGFPRVQRTTARPAAAPKPSTPGPGRPTGTATGPAPRHPVGKTTVKPHNPKRPKRTRNP
jgi:DDE superfamily endonuclease